MQDDAHNALHAFIADCETLLARHGVTKAAFVAGTMRREARVYRTPGLTVMSGLGKELEIVITYLEPKRELQPLSNPVLYRGEDGEIFRQHGQWSYGRRRVARLLAGERPQTPIALGRLDEGSTTGVD